METGPVALMGRSSRSVVTDGPTSEQRALLESPGRPQEIAWTTEDGTGDGGAALDTCAIVTSHSRAPIGARVRTGTRTPDAAYTDPSYDPRRSAHGSPSTHPIRTPHRPTTATFPQRSAISTSAPARSPRISVERDVVGHLRLRHGRRNPGDTGESFLPAVRGADGSTS